MINDGLRRELKVKLDGELESKLEVEQMLQCREICRHAVNEYINAVLSTKEEEEKRVWQRQPDSI